MTRKPSPSPSDLPPPHQPPASPFPPESPTSPATNPEARLSSPTSDPAIALSPTRLLEAKNPFAPPTSEASPAFHPGQTEMSLPFPPRHQARLPRPRGVRLPRIPGRFLGILAGLGIVGAVAYLGILPAWTGADRGERPLVSIAKKATLTITVSERGSVESQVTVDGICDLNGAQNKISYLIPEGTMVKKGDIVAKFDGSEIQKNIAQQEIKYKQATARIETTQQEMEIQRNKGESDIIAAKVELVLAELDLEKYQKGDYPAEFTKQEGEMSLKKKDVEAETAKLEQYKALMKKGFKTPEDVRIQNSTLAAKELDYSSSKQFLEVKQKYEYKRRPPSSARRSIRAKRKSSRTSPRRRPRCPRPPASTSPRRAPPSSSNSSSRSTWIRRRRRSCAPSKTALWPTATTIFTTRAIRSAREPRSTRAKKSSVCPT